MSATTNNSEPSNRAKRGASFWRLLFSLSALSLIAIVIPVWLFSNAYEGLLARRVSEKLQVTATAVAELLAERWPAEANAEAQAIVQRAGQRAGVRLTLIAQDGKVLADSSQRDVEAVRSMENHGHRLEVAAALHHGGGEAHRRSPTVRESFLYQAVQARAEGRLVGVVRAGIPAVSVEDEIAGLHRWMLAIGTLLAAACAASAYVIAARTTAPLGELSAAARALVAGEYDRRLPGPSGPSDEIGRIAAALNDVGKRLAQREGQLRSSSQTQATVLEAMSECVIAVDQGERILFANAAAGRTLNFVPAETDGRTLLEVVRSHELRTAMRKALHARELTTTELTWRGRQQRVFNVLATPLPGAPPAGVVLVLRDVTDLKRLEQMRQQFVANVSHELKTPLSSIRAYTETLLGGAAETPEHRQRFLERIDEQASRLQDLILDMLSLARIESSQALLEIAEVPVDRVVSRCLKDFESQAAAKGVILESETPDSGLIVKADEDALRQLLSNLVDNAVKYTPAAGRVAIRSRRDGSDAVIEVADSGIGIAAEHHSRLFERFYRVDKARSRALGGTGLGLSIVKHLCQAMGGSVSLESNVGQGSVFRVRLPLGRGAG